MTPGYQLFQAANNTAVMTDVSPDQRGVTSGMLNLSRNLGLITGASAMGALFALASGASDFTTAAPDAVAFGMRIAFAVAAVLVVIALIVAFRSHVAAMRSSRNPEAVDRHRAGACRALASRLEADRH